MGNTLHVRRLFLAHHDPRSDRSALAQGLYFSEVAIPMDAGNSQDVPSPAEREFIERVRRDRARGRALTQRSIVVALIAVSAGLLLVRSVSWRPASASAPSAMPATVPLASRPGPPDPALEHRVGRLETRVDAVEERAAVLERRVHPSQPASSAPPRPTVKAAPVSPKAPAAVSRPAAVTRQAAASSKRETARRPEPEVTFGDRVRRGWDTVERHVRRTPDDLRAGFNKVKRLFEG